MNIQIVSDLHLEFRTNIKEKKKLLIPSAPILALLGDTCCLGDSYDFNIFCEFIEEILPLFQKIIIITGNHEYYYNGKKNGITSEITINEIDKKLKKYCKITSPKLHFLNNNVLKIKSGKNKYAIIGSTLWSNIPPDQQSTIQNSMNDYSYIYVQEGKKIRRLLASDITAKFWKNYKYIDNKINKLSKLNYKIIVFTHHKPYVKSGFNPKSADVAYMSDCSNLFKKSVVLWAYGHTHIKDNTTVNFTKLYSNPKGYPGEKTEFNPSAVIKLN